MLGTSLLSRSRNELNPCAMRVNSALNHDVCTTACCVARLRQEVDRFMPRKCDKSVLSARLCRASLGFSIKIDRKYSSILVSKDARCMGSANMSCTVKQTILYFDTLLGTGKASC